MENEEKRTGLFEKIFAKEDPAETRRRILRKFKERHLNRRRKPASADAV